MSSAADTRIRRLLAYGRVRDAATGQALPGARVALGQQLGQPGEWRLDETETDAEGLFHFLCPRRFTAGTYDLGVAMDGYWPAAAGSTWNHLQSLALSPSEPAMAAVVLTPTTRLALRALAAAEAAVAGARVELRSAAGTVMWADTAPVTDAYGRWSLTDGPGDLFGFGTYAPGAPPAVDLTVAVQNPADGTWTPAATVSALRPGDSRFVVIRVA